MDKNRWSDYDKYLVLADESRTVLPSTLSGYLKFKELKVNLEKIARSSGKSWIADNKYGTEKGGIVLQKKITSADANTFLTNIYECKWTSKMFALIKVANQLGIDLKKDN